MKRGLVVMLLGILAVALLCLGASETLTNRTGRSASGIVIQFSQSVRISNYDESTFPDQNPSGRADRFTFSGGMLPNGGRFKVSWSPSSATITNTQWLQGSAAAASVASDSMGFPTSSDAPVVTGDLLNPAYFAHAAYVMQAVSDRDKVFAMPLLGVAELAFSPTMTDIDPSTVTWSFEVSHPAGIGAAIEDYTLYIWGSNLSWSGYGEVMLTGITADGHSGSVTIPITVFRTDKTLTDSDRKKDYFIPWSPQIDINRILSVEEHMRKYSKDEGELDRTIQWSRWTKMVPRHDVDLADIWLNELRSDGDWPQSTQFALVDVFLSDLRHLGIDAIRTLNAYCIADAESTDIYPNYNWNYFTLTKRPEEESYVINEAHRLGMTVATGNMVNIESETHWEELYAASPAPMETFFGNLEALNSRSLDRWTQLGVDMVDLCPAVSSMNKYDNTYQQAVQSSDGIVDLVRNARESYPGPLMHAAHYMADFFPGESILRAQFWEEFDVIGMSGWSIRLTDNPSPTTQELVNGWRALITNYFQPFQQRFDKPFLMWENGCLAAAGCARYGLICDRMPGYDALQPSLEDMARYYCAQDEAFQTMHGYYGPGWYRFPLHPYHRGGVRDTITATPRLKIEDTIQEICRGYAVPRIIQIDSDPSDWIGSYVVGTDPLGDARGVNDITSVSFTQDDDYLYFGVRYAAPPSTPGLMILRLDGGGASVVEVFLNNIWTQIHDWKSDIYQGQMGTGPVIGFADAIDAGSMIEVRIARRFLSGYLNGPSLTAQIVNFTQDWRPQDEAGWFDLAP
jgi:hypothetical protein